MARGFVRILQSATRAAELARSTGICISSLGRTGLKGNGRDSRCWLLHAVSRWPKPSIARLACQVRIPIHGSQPACMHSPNVVHSRCRSASRSGGRESSTEGLRKVRALTGRVLGNAQAGRPDGKCHRDIPPTLEEGPYAIARCRIRPLVSGLWASLQRARVKRRGKSSPATGRSVGQVNPTRSKTE